MSRGLCAERRVLRSRKLLLSLVGFAIFVLPVVFGFACAGEVSSQAIADNPVKDIDGTWQGTLHSEPNVPLGSLGHRPGVAKRLLQCRGYW